MRGHTGENREFYPENTECENQGLCRYPEPFKDSHHLYFPKRDYETQIERKWRNLGCHLIDICRCKHDELHATTEPPNKPSKNEMVQDIIDSGVNLSRSLRKHMRDLE